MIVGKLGCTAILIIDLAAHASPGAGIFLDDPKVEISGHVAAYLRYFPDSPR